ncbi:MAG: sulfatase [Planctomycetota bacterium]
MLGPSAWAQKRGTRKPRNILMLCVDDLRPELGCYGASHVHSPNIDAFAGTAMRFDRSYCQFPQCGPSRCSLLTGLRPETARHKGRVNYIDRNPIYRETATLAGHLTGQGYRTANYGKIYHSPRDDRKSWTDPQPLNRKELDYVWGYPGYGLRENVDLSTKIRREMKAAGRRGYFNGPSVEAADLPDDAYYDGLTTNNTIAMLREMAGEPNRPFFLAAGWYKPHLAFCAPKKYWDLYDRDAIALAGNNFHPTGTPEAAITPWAEKELRNYSDIPAEGSIPESKQRELIHGYYACISFIDTQIGRVLNELDRLGLADDTAVVMWGDHGFHLGENGHWTKNINWERSHHSPLLLRVPGMHRSGERGTDALVEFVDIYPTMLDAVGLPDPDHELQGQSLLPLLKSPSRSWKTAAFSMFGRDVSMRTDRYRYTPYRSAEGELIGEELFDLHADPMANTNLANDPDHAAVKARLTRQHADGWRNAKAPSV